MIQVRIDIGNVEETDGEIEFDVRINTGGFKKPAPRRRRIDRLTRRTIERLSYWVSCQEAFVQDDLRLIGEYLFRILLDDGDKDGALRDEFDSAYLAYRAEAEKPKAVRKDAGPVVLRIILRFEHELSNAAALLAGWPWEFLYFVPSNSKEGRFLAGPDTQLFLNRSVQKMKDTWREAGSRPPLSGLKILVATCLQANLPPREVEILIEKIKALGATVSPPLEDPTAEQLKAAITEAKPHIFHFIGHGKGGGIVVKSSPEEEAAGIAAGEKRPWSEMTPEEVGKLCDGHVPELVFLQSCEGAAMSGGFTSGALRLIAKGVPSVVAMQYEIKYGAANAFALAFYKSIAVGGTIDDAVAAGRVELGKREPARDEKVEWNNRRFGAPVLYLEAEDARLIAPLACRVCKYPLTGTEKFCPDCATPTKPSEPSASTDGGAAKSQRPQSQDAGSAANQQAAGQTVAAAATGATESTKLNPDEIRNIVPSAGPSTGGVTQ